MPLRDQFRPPISKLSSLKGFQCGWPMVRVRSLLPYLPKGYFAEPCVHLGNV